MTSQTKNEKQKQKGDITIKNYIFLTLINN